jgi:predicted membrane protein
MSTQKLLPILLISLGALLLLNNFLGVDINLFKLLLSVALIILGVSVLSGSGLRGGTQVDRSHTVLFSEGKNTVRDGAKIERFTTLFGAQKIKVEELHEAGKILEISTIFGETKLQIPRSMPVHISGNALFGEIDYPDGESISFGDRHFDALHDLNQPVLQIQAQAYFGSIKIRLV